MGENNRVISNDIGNDGITEIPDTAIEDGETDSVNEELSGKESEISDTAIEDGETDPVKEELSGEEEAIVTPAVIVEPTPWIKGSTSISNGSLFFIGILGLGIAAAYFYIRWKKKLEKMKAQKTVTKIVLTVGKVHGIGQRGNQQDSLTVTSQELYDTHGMLAVLADGMGGLEHGEKVSQCVVMSMNKTFLQTRNLSSNEVLHHLLEVANGEVNRLLGYEHLGKCGSTVVAGLIKEDMFDFISVGDSRIYLYRQGSLMQLNREHNYIRELQNKAINGEGTLEEARMHPKSSGLIN